MAGLPAQHRAGEGWPLTLTLPYRKDRDAARARHARSGLPFFEVLTWGGEI